MNIPTSIKEIIMFNWLYHITSKIKRKHTRPNKKPSLSPNKIPILKIKSDDENHLNIENATTTRGSISIKGTGNRVTFDVGVTFSGDLTIQGDGNNIFFGKDSVVRGRILVKGKNQNVIVGEKTTFGSVYMLCQEGCNIHIGSWCMFSRSIEIRTTDAHSVVDIETNMRLNAPESIRIGNHVWVGVGTLINKGCQIANDSIVGAHSFINKKFNQPNIIIAGSPAVVVRTGVTWHRGRKKKFKKSELDIWKNEAL